MSLLDRFLAQLGERGLTVEYRDEGTLALVGPAAEKTPEVLRACKAFKPDLLRRLGPKAEAAAAEADNPANVERPVEPVPEPVVVTEQPPATTRAELVAGVFARRDGRRVFGYDSASGRGGPVPAAELWPDNYDRACVEGESQWTLLPTT